MKLLLLALVLIFTSCGTETGNPATESDLSSGDNESSYAESLSSKICSKLVACFSEITSTSDCMTEINDENGFDTALGNSDYNTLSEFISAESNGSIVKNQTEATQCLSDIENLACSDTEVTSAFSSSSPNDYSNIANIVSIGSGSCQDFYQ